MLDSVYHSRAVPTSDDLENDPDVMVHQQLARLYFFERLIGCEGKTVLDFGCGSGFNCHLLARNSDVVGFDYSPAAVELATKAFPACRFLVADGCDPTLNLGKFQRIICCEVLEHVPDMKQFVANISNHLSSDGVAFITTPNVVTFSNGHRPSPMNREHIRELDIQEFREMLSCFRQVDIYGQRFNRSELADNWSKDVENKIKLLEIGQRWKERAEPHAALRAIHRLPPVRWAWTQLRWKLLGKLHKRKAARTRPYSFRDFEFVHNEFANALWFCAVVQN